MHNVNNFNGATVGIPSFYHNKLKSIIASSMLLCATKDRKLTLPKPFGDFDKIDLAAGKYSRFVNGHGSKATFAYANKIAAEVRAREQSENAAAAKTAVTPGE